MRKKIIKLVLFVLVLVAVFPLGASAMVITDAGIQDDNNMQYYSVGSLGADRNIRNFNSDTVITLDFTLMFFGSYYGEIRDRITSVIEGHDQIYDIIVFGNGSWYDSLEVLDMQVYETDPYTWLSIYEENGDNRRITNRLRTVVKFRLIYTQPAGVPTYITQYAPIDLQNVMTVSKTDFNITLPWLTDGAFSCFYQVDRVSVSAPVGQRKYLRDGDNWYKAYFLSTFNQPFAVAVGQYNYFRDPSLLPAKFPEESMEFTFDVAGNDYILDGSVPYSIDGGVNLGRSPKFGRLQFKSFEVDFYLRKLTFVPEKSYINQVPLWLELRCSNDGSSSTRVQKSYNPSAFCYTSFTYTNAITITNSSETDEFDTSSLYTEITFSVPEWGEGDNFGENLGLFFVGFLEAILTLVGGCLYNAAVWIFCETPVLSQLTKPLFMLMVEAGSLFTEYFIPFLGALGFFTPIVCIFIVIGIIKKYGGVNDD